MKTIKINNIDHMSNFATSLGNKLKGGEVILLKGDLGAGKTHMAKFIGQGMGIEDYITSPTFALLNIYKGNIDLYHIDAYRLEGQIDLDDLGFEEYLYSEAVTIIEWPEMIMEIIPEDHILIDIEKTDKEEERILKISYADKYSYILENII